MFALLQQKVRDESRHAVPVVIVVVRSTSWLVCELVRALHAVKLAFAAHREREGDMSTPICTAENRLKHMLQIASGITADYCIRTQAWVSWCERRMRSSLRLLRTEHEKGT